MLFKGDISQFFTRVVLRSHRQLEIVAMYEYTALDLYNYDERRSMPVFPRLIKYICDITKNGNMFVFTRTFLYIQRRNSATVRRAF